MLDRCGSSVDPASPSWLPLSLSLPVSLYLITWFVSVYTCVGLWLSRRFCVCFSLHMWEEGGSLPACSSPSIFLSMGLWPLCVPAPSLHLSLCLFLSVCLSAPQPCLHPPLCVCVSPFFRYFSSFLPTPIPKIAGLQRNLGFFVPSSLGCSPHQLSDPGMAFSPEALSLE